MIDNHLRARVQEVRDHAEQPAHHWRHMDPSWNPGTDDRHKLVTEFGYRVVFSISLKESMPPIRHLSVSVPGTGYPHETAVLVLAKLFGFTGDNQETMTPDPSWAISLDPNERCIIVAQIMEAADRGVMVS